MVAEATKFIAAMTDQQVKESCPDGRRPTEAELRAEIVKEHAATVGAAARGQVVAQVEPAPEGKTHIDGVTPGRVRIALERGDDWDAPQVLAEAVVEIVKGVDARVTLTIEPPREVARRVRLAGSVRFSPAWNSSRLDLRFKPAVVPGSTTADEFKLGFRDLDAIAGPPGVYRFDAGTVLPGRYLVRSYSCGFQQFVDTGPDGTESAQVVIGNPADVVVHAIDDLTGSPICGKRLVLWNCKPLPEGERGSVDGAEWSALDQAWCFRAPAGEI
ncbi:MAG: hypothetical protein EXS13_14215 [Planctomycetes bacterium]|nr:hypothetical protein [Planctomycetota bacterium]